MCVVHADLTKVKTFTVPNMRGALEKCMCGTELRYVHAHTWRMSAHPLTLHWAPTHACGAQGGSFAYLTPAFAIIAQIKARGAWVDAANGTNHARFMVRQMQGLGFDWCGHGDSASGTHTMLAAVEPSQEILECQCCMPYKP